MIRLIQRRLIIPRGDTGSFSIPALKSNTDNIAVFTIFDESTKTRMFQKMIQCEGDIINIAFTHSDTVNLKPGKYVWDIKYYSNPEFIDDELVNGEEIDSYYAGFSLPVCEIRETADNYLVSPEAPTATLSPEQLEIVTGAIHSLNEAIRKTQENVEHYPEIRDEVWYTWDAELGDYVNTGVRANGIVGNGIASAVLNDDYTLTLNFTDGTSFTSTSIRGETGNGIDDIVLNNDFTLTITYTDGESYTTPSIRGPVGATPQFSIGTVQDGAVAAASITGTAENPVLNLTLPNAHVPIRVSQLENDAGYLTDVQVNGVSVLDTQSVANVPVANSTTLGVVKIRSDLDVNILSDGSLTTSLSTMERIKAGTHRYSLIKPVNQHASVFYGLAKAAGDTTQSQSSNAMGTYTNEAKTAIQQMLDVPSTSDIPTQVSELTNDAGYLTTETDPTVPAWAKAAQKPSYTAAEVGATTEQEVSNMIAEAIGQINSFDMAVVQTLPTQNISTHTIYLVPKTGETNDVYDEYIYINNNWEMVGNTQIDLSDYATKDELPDVPVQDVQVNGTSVLNSGIANVDAVMVPGTGVGSVKTRDFENNGTTYTVESSGFASFAEGAFTAATGMASHVEGSRTLATGQAAHAEGASTYSLSRATHAEGYKSIAVGYYSHSENYCNAAKGTGSHVEGMFSIAYGDYSHVEGSGYNLPITLTSTNDPFVYSYVFNSPESFLKKSRVIYYNQLFTTIKSVDTDNKTITVNNTIGSDLDKASAQLYMTAALGGGSHVEGRGTISHSQFQHVQGKYNSEEAIDYADIVGNGEDEDNRSNAYALDWEGNGHYAGDVYVHANMDSTGGVKLATIEDIPDAPVQDVQVNGVSVLSDGVANVPVASPNTLGVLGYAEAYGISKNNSGQLRIVKAISSRIAAGTNDYYPIVASNQHESTFYGLAKAAGDTTQSASSNTVGVYTDNAKASIKAMLGIQDGSTGTVDVSGTTPTITAVENTRYVCGEVTSLSFTPPASGISIVRFTSGSTVTVLTLPSTVKFPEWFDPTSLETNTIYEICVTDGIYGAVMSWAQ